MIKYLFDNILKAVIIYLTTIVLLVTTIHTFNIQQLFHVHETEEPREKGPAQLDIWEPEIYPFEILEHGKIIANEEFDRGAELQKMFRLWVVFEGMYYVCEIEKLLGDHLGGIQKIEQLVLSQERMFQREEVPAYCFRLLKISMLK